VEVSAFEGKVGGCGWYVAEDSYGLVGNVRARGKTKEPVLLEFVELAVVKVVLFEDLNANLLF
jgi:hypothetical protein